MKPLESSVLAAELAAIDAIPVALELAEKRGSISISSLLRFAGIPYGIGGRVIDHLRAAGKIVPSGAYGWTLIRSMGERCHVLSCDDQDTSHLRQNGGGQQDANADWRQCLARSSVSNPPIIGMAP